MLNTFISSPAAQFGLVRLGVAALSVLAHAGIVTLAVIGSGNPPARFDPSSRLVSVERVIYVGPRERRADVARRVAIARAATHRTPLIVPDMRKLTAVIDATISTLPLIPELAFDASLVDRTVDAHDFGDADTRQLLDDGAMYALAHPDRAGAYSEDVVEKSAWPVRDNPQPRYPDLLRRQGIEQSFVVDFVIDSTGRVDERTLAFPDTVHPMFLTAVKDALLHSRYLPAELAGMRVRQLVHQKFTFVIGRP